MIQFQENAWTDGRMDGRTDRCYFIGLFQLMLGVEKKKLINTNGITRHNATAIYHDQQPWRSSFSFIIKSLQFCYKI